jgi:hypothetical protein
VLGSFTNLVEIDLLHDGKSMAILHNDIKSDYWILVSRGEHRPLADLYAFNLPNPIPSFTLPLRKEDVEPVIDLQLLINEIYERGSYDLIIDYHSSTDSMIFILNRVDQRGADDLPLSVRIDKLREEIKEVLSLPELPDVLPFNARLLYYAQCAWGSGAFNEPSQIAQEVRLKFLKAMFQDCIGVIRLNTKENRDLKNWFRDIEDWVEENRFIDDKTTQKILSYALEWTGGKELWNRFRVRVQESFAELVILPALVEVFDNYSVLSEYLDILIQTRKISNQKQVEEERERIIQIRQTLHKNINKIGREFKTEIEQLIGGLKTDNPNTKLEIKQNAEKKGRNGFSLIFDAVSEVEGNLNKVLIVPVRDALKNNQGAFELRDKLREVTSPSLADDIAKTYDNVSRRLSQFAPESKYLVKRVRADDDKGKKELEHDERHVRLLYYTMREAISARAEFILQGKAKQFEQALESLVNEQLKRLKICLSEENLASSINLEKAAISDLHKKLAQNLPTLPENFFQLPDTIKQSHSKKTEVVGTKTEYEKRTKTEYENYTEYYEEGSCFKSTKTRTKTRPVTRNFTQAVTRDIMADVDYVELFLPPPDLMAKQWLSGIEKAKGSLWDILLEWILKRLDYVGSIFQESVDDITNLAERALEKQLSIIEENFEQEKQFWLNFQVQKDNTTTIYQKLRKDFC